MKCDALVLDRLSVSLNFYSTIHKTYALLKITSLDNTRCVHSPSVYLYTVELQNIGQNPV